MQTTVSFPTLKYFLQYLDIFKSPWKRDHLRITNTHTVFVIVILLLSFSCTEIGKVPAQWYSQSADPAKCLTSYDHPASVKVNITSSLFVQFTTLMLLHQ